MKGIRSPNAIQSLWHQLRGGIREIDQVLKPGDLAPPSNRRVASAVVACGVLYGIVMGSYAMVAGHRSLLEQLPQMLYSATKVPLLLAVTVSVSLPSFFVMNSLLGLRDDFHEAVRAVIAAQAGMTIVLLSLAPLTMFVYVALVPNQGAYRLAVLFNAMTFGFSSISAQLLLRRYYIPLFNKDRRHRTMVTIWIFLYAFVGIQCAYIMRPFIGDPSSAPSWFRADSFQNAYVKVFRLIVGALQ